MKRSCNDRAAFVAMSVLVVLSFPAIMCFSGLAQAQETDHAAEATDEMPKESLAAIKLVPPEEAYVQDGVLYSDAIVRAHVCIQGDDIDPDHTTIMGQALSTLFDDEADECVWKKQVTEDGTRYTGELWLDEGQYGPSDLCGAYTLDGASVDTRCEYDELPVSQVIVDLSAPAVKATVSREPLRTFILGEERVALYGDPVAICLEFEDLSGIRSAMLANEDGASHMLEPGDSPNKMTVLLSDDELTKSERLTVLDRAGNKTVWSLDEWGSEETASGVQDVMNAPLSYEDTGEPVADDKRWTRIIADATGPQVSLEGVDDRQSYNSPRVLKVTLSDERLGYMALVEPERTIMRVMKDGIVAEELAVGFEHASSSDVQHTYTLTLPARDSHADDGHYSVEVLACDLSGNESCDLRREFEIDTRAPVLEVESIQRPCEGTISLFAGRRDMRIRVADSGLLLEDLNGSDSPIQIRMTACDGKSVADIDCAVWQKDDAKGCYTLALSFPANGTYELWVSGADKAGNCLVGGVDTDVAPNGTYCSGAFTTDDEQPRIEMAFAPATPQPHELDGTRYFNQPVTIDVLVWDRNLESGQIRIEDDHGAIVPAEWAQGEKDESGERTYRASVVFDEGGDEAGRGVRRIRVVATDLMQNGGNATFVPFVVDTTPPVVHGAYADAAPAAMVPLGEWLRPTWFFGGPGVDNTTLTFSFVDSCALDEAWIRDPSHVYATRTDAVRGALSGELRVDLRDPVRDRLSQSAVFDDTISLFVRDMAGNVAEWKVGGDRCVPVAADSVKPQDANEIAKALVFDVTAPRVALSGVEQGEYSNRPLTAHVEVQELNFEALRACEPQRMVAHIRRHEEKGQDAAYTIGIAARHFAGDHGVYAYDQQLSEDGHYDLSVQVPDLAGNESNMVHVGDVTVDQTPPHISVAWDNEDVRNGTYYNSGRVATVQVAEHNFDPTLFLVQTTGTVYEWSDEGDYHTCHVSFDTDSSAENPHRLHVQGTDLAGNEAQPYDAAPFVIDTKAPTVVLSKRTSDNDRDVASGPVTELVDGSAFADALELHVLFEDSECLDASSLEVSLTGARSLADASELGERHLSNADRQIEVVWDNLGAAAGEDGRYYAVSADDVYTIRATVRDMAGNESPTQEARFSVNRYGSNFFVQRVGESRQSSRESWDNNLLVNPPLIEVHEINVSGDAASSSEDDAHVVTKQFGRETKRIEHLEDENAHDGYSLATSTSASMLNPFEGWTEHVYLIRPGNFGLGSDTDYGDGGQGTYSVAVGSRDKALNENTLSSYWSSADSARASVQEKNATVTFTLDEIGPKILDVQAPPAFAVGQGQEVSFFVRDQITEGDYVSVLVDGEPAQLRWADSDEPLPEDGQIDREGTLEFSLDAKPVWFGRDIEIFVEDYTHNRDRSDTAMLSGFVVTTLLPEAGIAVLVIGALVAACLGMRSHARHAASRRKESAWQDRFE